MRASRRSLALLLATWLLPACGPQESVDSAPPSVQDSVLGDAIGAMDKARTVEDTTLQHKQELDRALDVAEGEH